MWIVSDGYVLKRVNDIRAAMQKSGAQDATLPFALIENGSRCQKNAENEQILPNECIWIPNLIESAVDLALLHRKGYMYYPHKKSNLLQKLLIIPLVFITQVSASARFHGASVCSSCCGGCHHSFQSLLCHGVLWHQCVLLVASYLAANVCIGSTLVVVFSSLACFAFRMASILVFCCLPWAEHCELFALVAFRLFLWTLYLHCITLRELCQG